VSAADKPATDGPATRRAEPVAPRPRRLLLAYGYVFAVAVAAGAAIGLRGRAAAVVQLVALIAMVWLWFALRRATRLVVDAPGDAVDELRGRLRDRVFVLAYQLLAVVVIVIAALLILTSGGGIPEPVAIGLAWAGLGSALGLPVVVAAVALPD
jgi:hypothetical protein